MISKKLLSAAALLLLSASGAKAATPANDVRLDKAIQAAEQLLIKQDKQTPTAYPAVTAGPRHNPDKMLILGCPEAVPM